MYAEQEELRAKQLEITTKLIASGGIRTHANYEVKQENINNEKVNVFRVTDDLKELERALLYDQFGKEGDRGCIYLKKDTQVYDLFVNRLNNNGIFLNNDPIYNKELDEYFVSFQITDVDELFIKFSELTNPLPTLKKVELDISFEEDKISINNDLSFQEKNKSVDVIEGQLSLFDSFDVSEIKNEPTLIKDVEPEVIVFEEGEEFEDIWQEGHTDHE